MVGRGTDQRLAGLSAPERRDVGGRLAPRELAPLARLGALGDLDLELLSAGEVLRGDPEPGRRDLLDPGVSGAGRARPAASGRYQAGSSPPSPVFAAPPIAWMPSVSARCASGDSAPTLIADTTNRRAIAAAGSTDATRAAIDPARSGHPPCPHGPRPADRASASRYVASAASTEGAPSVVPTSTRVSAWTAFAMGGA